MKRALLPLSLCLPVASACGDATLQRNSLPSYFLELLAVTPEPMPGTSPPRICLSKEVFNDTVFIEKLELTFSGDLFVERMAISCREDEEEQYRNKCWLSSEYAEVVPTSIMDTAGHEVVACKIFGYVDSEMLYVNCEGWARGYEPVDLILHSWLHDMENRPLFDAINFELVADDSADCEGGSKSSPEQGAGSR